MHYRDSVLRLTDGEPRGEHPRGSRSTNRADRQANFPSRMLRIRGRLHPTTLPPGDGHG
jgi:hypothetical protein